MSNRGKRLVKSVIKRPGPLPSREDLRWLEEKREALRKYREASPYWQPKRDRHTGEPTYDY